MDYSHNALTRFFLAFAILQIIARRTLALPKKDLPEINGNKFNYFGYGSNMLEKRIHIQNPTAVKIGGGLLKDYRLDFNGYSGRWQGAPATIVPTTNETVYGTLWEISLDNLDDIDDQEGVPEGMYEPTSVSIELLSNHTMIMARAYMLVDQPATKLADYTWESVPQLRQPSKTYLQCLVKGAIESGLLPSHVQWLKSLKHNGFITNDMQESLDLKQVELQEHEGA